MTWRARLLARIRRVGVVLVIAVAGLTVALLGWFLPAAMAGSGVSGVDPALRGIARRALEDVRAEFFEDGLESYLVRDSFVDRVDTEGVPEACPEGTAYAARIRARTMWWIPYDDALWCGDPSGLGTFITRQAAGPGPA